jgi:hypothetical protein
METWLILVGVLLPLAPLLQIAEKRLTSRGSRPASVSVDATRQRSRAV